MLNLDRVVLVSSNVLLGWGVYILYLDSISVLPSSLSAYVSGIVGNTKKLEIFNYD